MWNKIFVSDCRQFPDIYISQSSVSMRLRCDGIFNDQSEGELFWKSVNICKSYGQLSTGSFFYETRCINIHSPAKYYNINLNQLTSYQQETVGATFYWHTPYIDQNN